MNIPKYLLYSLLLSFFLVSAGQHPGSMDDCEDLKLEVVKTDTKDNSPNGKIEIVSKKRDAKSQFIFCKASGEVLNEGAFQKNTIEHLSAGEYYCLVVSKNCHKKLKITILWETIF